MCRQVLKIMVHYFWLIFAPWYFVIFLFLENFNDTLCIYQNLKISILSHILPFVKSLFCFPRSLFPEGLYLHAPIWSRLFLDLMDNHQLRLAQRDCLGSNHPFLHPVSSSFYFSGIFFWSTYSNNYIENDIWKVNF